jgi:HPt (histidine-containing phosphotransfer) domain-containing protein
MAETDQAELRAIAHALAGSAGSLGFDAVSAAAFALEAALTTRANDNERQDLATIEGTLNALLQAIAAELSTSA